MSREKRTVSNGGLFSQSIHRPLRRSHKICPCCKSEKASINDHIQPWQWGGTNAVLNLGIICAKCNQVKTAFEDMIQEETGLSPTLKIKLSERHVQYWWDKHFTPAGNRRPAVQLNRDELAAVIARRVSKSKQVARKVKAKMSKEEVHLAKFSPSMLELMVELDEISDDVNLDKVGLLKRQMSKAARARQLKTGQKKTYLSALMAQGNVN